MRSASPQSCRTRHVHVAQHDMYGGGAQSQQRSRRIRRWDHHVILGLENPSRKLVDGDVIVDDHDDRGGGARQQGLAAATAPFKSSRSRARSAGSASL